MIILLERVKIRVGEYLFIEKTEQKGLWLWYWAK